MKDLISIILPVYNAELYVKSAVESLQNQTYSNIEIIIIDDGSTDSSYDICKTYESDSRIRLFHKKNEGLSATRQFGIDKVNGKYFTTIDADDYVAPKYIEAMYAMVSKTGADICVSSKYYDVYETGKTVLVGITAEKEIIAIDKNKLKNHLTDLSNQLQLSDSWSKLYSSDFVKKSGVRFDLSKGYRGNDLAFNYKLVLHSPKYCIIDTPLLYHRILKGSIVHRYNENFQDGIEIILCKIIEEAEKCGVEITVGLNNLYYTLLYIAYNDICKYSTNRIRHLRNFTSKHMSFVRRYKWLSYSAIKRSSFQKLICCLASHDSCILLFLLSYVVLGRQFLHKIKSSILNKEENTA